MSTVSVPAKRAVTAAEPPEPLLEYRVGGEGEESSTAIEISGADLGRSSNQGESAVVRVLLSLIRGACMKSGLLFVDAASDE